MPLELNVADDFATILDGSEPITLRRQGTPETIPVAAAWRFLEKSDEVEIGAADYARNDVLWQLPWDASHDEPRLGDLIIDAADQCWTILSVERLRLNTRFRCLARNLSLAFGLDTRVDIQRAEVEDPSVRPESVEWITIQAAVPARILLDRTRVIFDPGDPDDPEEPIDPSYSSTATYRIVLGEQIELDHNHRLIYREGTVFEVTEFAHFGRIDRLPVATVVKRVETS